MSGLFVGGRLYYEYYLLLMYKLSPVFITLVLIFNCSTLPAVQPVSVMNNIVVPAPTISVAMGSSTSQQPAGGSDDIATTVAHGLFANRTEDSDDDYDN